MNGRHDIQINRFIDIYNCIHLVMYNCNNRHEPRATSVTQKT